MMKYYYEQQERHQQHVSDDTRVLSAIDKPAWAFDPSVHPALVKAMRVHAQRSSLRHDGRTTEEDKQEISDLFQQPQPSMSDDIAVALGIDPSIIDSLSYSVTFGYLLRSIVTMVLKADGDTMDPSISFFLRNALDTFHQGHGNLLTKRHPLKVGVLDQVQTTNTWGREGGYVTLELLHDTQLCALLIPENIGLRKKIEIEFNPNYRSKTTQFSKTPVVTTSEENVPSVFMRPETYHEHHHPIYTEYQDDYHNDQPVYTHFTHSYADDTGYPSQATHNASKHQLLPPTMNPHSHESFSSYGAATPMPPMQSMQHEEFVPHMMPPPPAPMQPQSFYGASKPEQTPSSYSMEGFDAFNSLLGGVRKQTFPISRMGSSSEFIALSTPWNLRIHGNRFPSNAASRLAGTADPIKATSRWGS